MSIYSHNKYTIDHKTHDAPALYIIMPHSEQKLFWMVNCGIWNRCIVGYPDNYEHKLRFVVFSLQWRHNERDSVSNHQPHDCFLNRLFTCRLKKTPKLHVTGLCAGNSAGAGEFPAQMASNAENFSIWWRHHVVVIRYQPILPTSLRVTSLALGQYHCPSAREVTLKLMGKYITGIHWGIMI